MKTNVWKTVKNFDLCLNTESLQGQYTTISTKIQTIVFLPQAKNLTPVYCLHGKLERGAKSPPL